MSTCPGTESTYVPWSWGEVFQCTTCGAKERQHHTTPKLRVVDGNYADIYPMPEHERAQEAERAS